MPGRHRFRGIATLREILGHRARPPVAPVRYRCPACERGA